MPRLYPVRHAKPAASWGQDPDPGLDATGIWQARATAQGFAGSLSRDRRTAGATLVLRCRTAAGADQERLRLIELIEKRIRWCWLANSEAR